LAYFDVDLKVEPLGEPLPLSHFPEIEAITEPE
jgi:hypothetical protein